MDLRWIFDSIEEDSAPQRASLQGTIPNWLQGGKILMIGPGLFQLGNFKLKSLLDGYGLLINVVFTSDKEITIQRRYLQSDAYKKGVEASMPIYTEFCTRGQPDPNKNFFIRFISNFKPNVSDNGNHNICFCHGKILAMTQSSSYRIVDHNTLETLDKIDLSKKGVILLSPHPQVDHDGTTYNVGVGLHPTFKYVVLKSTINTESGMSDAVTLATVAPSMSTKFSLVHSFGLTENYIIIIEQPYYVNGIKVLKAVPLGRSFRESLEWCPENMTKFIVIDKKSGNRISTNYVSPGFFFAHVINCYEDKDHIVIDLVTYDNDPFDNFLMENLTSGCFHSTDESWPKRFVLPLESIVKDNLSENFVTLNYTSATATLENDGSILCQPEVLFDSPGSSLDNPIINAKLCSGRPYRYFYGCSGFLSGVNSATNSLIKADLKEKRLITWYAGENYYCGSCIFASSSSAAETEDDGLVIALINSSDPHQKDILVILDSKTLVEVARAELPVHIPVMVHGIFLGKMGAN